MAAAPIAWPATVPSGALADSFAERPGQSVLTTAMAAGPAKKRRRTTAAPAELDVTLLLDPIEVDDFQAWFDGPLAGGALSFDFTHPRTRAPVTCRMRGDAVPVFKPVSGQRGTLWHVVLQLEVLP